MSQNLSSKIKKENSLSFSFKFQKKKNIKKRICRNSYMENPDLIFLNGYENYIVIADHILNFKLKEEN